MSDKGIVRHASVNDVEVGRCVNETYRLVLGFRYTDKHGEGEWLNLANNILYVWGINITVFLYSNIFSVSS